MTADLSELFAFQSVVTELEGQANVLQGKLEKGQAVLACELSDLLDFGADCNLTNRAGMRHRQIAFTCVEADLQPDVKIDNGAARAVVAHVLEATKNFKLALESKPYVNRQAVYAGTPASIGDRVTFKPVI